VKILMWVALVIACIALGLSIVTFTNLSGRVDDLEEAVSGHSTWIEEAEEALKSLEKALTEGAGEIMESLSELSCEVPLPEE